MFDIRKPVSCRVLFPKGACFATLGLLVLSWLFNVSLNSLLLILDEEMSMKFSMGRVKLDL